MDLYIYLFTRDKHSEVEKANIRNYLVLYPKTRLGSERLVVKISYALHIYRNHEQAGAKLHQAFLLSAYMAFDNRPD